MVISPLSVLSSREWRIFTLLNNKKIGIILLYQMMFSSKCGVAIPRYNFHKQLLIMFYKQLLIMFYKQLLIMLTADATESVRLCHPKTFRCPVEHLLAIAIKTVPEKNQLIPEMVFFDSCILTFQGKGKKDRTVISKQPVFLSKVKA
jgi:hypothetical protein